MTRNLLRLVLLGAIVAAPAAALAQRRAPAAAATDATGSIGGRAPWSPPYQYDSGGDNDRRPELPAYQQGGGQQTGGPARNLIPQDSLTITPR